MAQSENLNNSNASKLSAHASLCTFGMNDKGTSAKSGTELTQPRSLSDLRRFLHSYRIRNAGDQARTTRASIIYGGLGAGRTSPMTQRAARELAELDSSLAWLPTWKPRARVVAASQ